MKSPQYHTRRLLSRLLLVGLLSLLGVSLLFPWACTPGKTNESTTEAAPDAATTDTAPPEAAVEAAAEKVTCPTPSNPCLPGCGNELGVGQHCTRGGGECNTNKKAILCTGDFNKTTDLVYCVRPCVTDEDCGTDAVCTRDPKDPKGGAGCIPASCVDKPAETTPEATTEAPKPDAGSGE